MDENVQARFGGSTSSSTTSVETMEKGSSSPPRKVVVPTENLRIQRRLHRVIKFTTDEDEFLKRGIDRHGYGQWTAILRDSDFKFQEGRTADSLRKRAGLRFRLSSPTKLYCFPNAKMSFLVKRALLLESALCRAICWAAETLIAPYCNALFEELLFSLPRLLWYMLTILLNFQLIISLNIQHKSLT